MSDDCRGPGPRRRPRHGWAQGRARHGARRDRLVGAHARADARRPRRRADAGRRAVVAGGRASVRRAAGSADLSRVVAVSVTGQWASTVPVDEEGRPVGPCVLWSDTRGAPYSRAAVGGPVSGYAPKPLATWLRRSGGIPTVSGDDPVGHILFLQHEQPDVVARARWLLEPVDYLTMRFTGVPAASHASMTGAWLTDNRSLATLAYDDVLVRATGVDASRLPPLVATGSVVGTCRRRWPRTSGSLRRPSPSPACPTCTRPPSVRVRSGWGSRTPRSARRPGSARRCRARRATCCGCRPRSRAWTTRRTSSPTTRSPPAATCSGGATRSRPSSATTTCWRRRPPRLRGPAGWCSRRGSPASGRRSTTATPAPASTGSAGAPRGGT